MSQTEVQKKSTSVLINYKNFFILRLAQAGALARRWCERQSMLGAVAQKKIVWRTGAALPQKLVRAKPLF